MSKPLKIFFATLLVCLLGIIQPVYGQDEGVTLTSSQITWQTLAYELDADNGIVRGSVDPKTVVEHTFDTYILENEYLKVTLLLHHYERLPYQEISAITRCSVRGVETRLYRARRLLRDRLAGLLNEQPEP